MRINQLGPVFDTNQVIYFEGKLYERLYTSPKARVKESPRHKYRVILSTDDYDYVQEPALRKRLDRAFARSN